MRPRHYPLPILIFSIFALISCREINQIDGQLAVVPGQTITVKDVSGRTHELSPGKMKVSVKDTGAIILEQGQKKVQLRLNQPRRMFRFQLDLKAKEIGQAFDLVGSQRTVVMDQGNRWVKKACDGCPVDATGTSRKKSPECEGKTQWLEDYRTFKTEVELTFEQGGKAIGRFSGSSTPFEQTHRVAETMKSTCQKTAKKDKSIQR